MITGPRQAGKTTLARHVTSVQPANAFDLENPSDLSRLADPMLTLARLDGLVLIDEAQQLPGLIPVLRVLVDRPDRDTRFLVAGSASPDLVGLSAESLAGRVEIVELGGFRLPDVGGDQLDRLWERGGLPPAYTAATTDDSVAWREQYISTFLERDLARLGFRTPATTMRRAWTMLAHYHGQTWSGAELARALDVAQSTARRYLDALTDALVVRQLQPWFANISKRQVKSPKIYIRDSGIAHRLLGIDDAVALASHPKVGASWEGFIVEQLAAIVSPANLYYWRTQQGAELDVYVEIGGRRIGFEIKRTSTPRMTRSMHSAIADLQLDVLVVVHAAEHSFAIAPVVAAIPAAKLLSHSDASTLMAHVDTVIEP